MAAHSLVRRQGEASEGRWTPWTSGGPHFWGGASAPCRATGRNERFGCESGDIARIALVLLALLAWAPATATAQSGPAGQFLPSLGDRDGDGLLDTLDCAADDPSRPSRAGSDLDCDGAPDGGGAGIGVGLLPVDGGPDEPEEQQVASRPSTGSRSARAAARDAAGEPVVLVKGLSLGPAVAVYAPAEPRATEPTLIFAAKGNVGLTVTPTVGDRRRASRTRSLPQGRAYVVRLRLRRPRPVSFDIAVVGTDGAEYTATRAVAAGGRRTS